MQLHWRTIQWATLVLAFAVIASIVKGWFFIAYGVAMFTAVVAFVYLVANGRFSGRASDSDEEAAKRRGR
jgi:hypothetical protein